MQFGFRYIIDLLPVGFVVFALAFDRFPRPLLVASLLTFALNVYGLAGWKHFPRQPRDAPWLRDQRASPPPPAELSVLAPSRLFRAVPPNREG